MAKRQRLPHRARIVTDPEELARLNDRWHTETRIDLLPDEALWNVVRDAAGYEPIVLAMLQLPVERFLMLRRCAVGTGLIPDGRDWSRPPLGPTRVSAATAAWLAGDDPQPYLDAECAARSSEPPLIINLPPNGRDELEPDPVVSENSAGPDPVIGPG
jgi:hypothetical protein